MNFADQIESISKEYIYHPCNEDEIKKTMARYEEVGLPGAVGSVDVVHIKWSNCPAGHMNRSKGKEGYPTLAFECVSDYDRRITGVFGPHFGTQNDKHIVKMDPNVATIHADWYAGIGWNYYDEYGVVQTETGLYLICDNGYLQWPILICPFMRLHNSGRLEDYYSSNLESVRKDVECVFGILKARWTCLDKGFKYRDITHCRKIFVSHCVLHNMMLDEMVREEKAPRIGRGCSIGDDNVWLEGPTEEVIVLPSDAVQRSLKVKFDKRRMLLCHHLKHWKEKMAAAGEILAS